MSYTAQKIHNMSVAIIDELNDAGAIDANKTKEYGNRAPFLLDLWQKEMAKSGNLYKTFELSCIRKTNLLGEFDSFLMVEHAGGVDKSYEATGANCFHFGVDSAANVYIEQLIGSTWTSVVGTYIDEQTATETAFNGLIAADTTSSSFNHYRGIITATNKVRIRFSGDYYYRHTNRALCPHKFATATKVPVFKAWYKVDMPTDFKSRTQVIAEYPMWQYESDAGSKWENGNELYVQFGYEGIIRVNYVPVPVEITALTQTLEIDDVAATSGAYYLAEHYALADQNDSLARMCRDKFKSLKMDSMIQAPLSTSEIVDFYGLGGS